jgi:TRAP-type C4-dicarboxylate transport system permease large subunit
MKAEVVMRSTYLFLMLLFPLLAILNAVWFGSELQKFAKEVRTFSSTHEIERFKGVVGRQMYAALVQIVLLVVPPILFFVGIAKGALTPGDIIFIIVPSAVVIAVAALYKQTEKQVKEIPANDDELRRQRDVIIHTWLKKPLPDW